MPSTHTFDHLLPVRIGFGRALGVGLLVFGFASWCGEARAQADPETEVARTRFREGVALYDRGEFEKARLAFLEAYALRPHPTVRLNLAQSELRAGRFADAATNLAAYLKENLDPADRERASKAFKEAKARSVEIRVRTSLAGAEVFVDGRARGISPLAELLYLTPGSHAVGARKGEAKVTKVISAQAGERLVTRLELPTDRQAPKVASPKAGAPGPAERPRAGAAAPQGTVAGGRKKEGGQRVATLDAGDASRPGFFTWVGQRPLAVATVATAGASLATSAVMFFMANDRFDYAESVSDLILVDYGRRVDPGPIRRGVPLCGESGLPSGNPDLFTNAGQDASLRATIVQEYTEACDAFSDGRSKGRTYRSAGWVTLGLGLGLGAATAIAYFSGDAEGAATARGAEPQRRRATLQPIVNPSVQGLWVNVSF